MTKKTKKIIGGATAISIVAALAAGGTLAYLTHETEHRANNFTFSHNRLNAMLTEPKWDGVVDYEYNDDGSITPIYDYKEVEDTDNPGETKKIPVYGYENGDPEKPVTDKDEIKPTTTRPNYDPDDETKTPINYGVVDSKNMVPGSIAEKNPFITNTSEELDEWLAAKITFVYTQDQLSDSGEVVHKAGEPLDLLDMGKINEVIQINYKTGELDNWERISSTETDVSQTFYYKNLVKSQKNLEEGETNTTDPIFESVSVNKNATNEQIDALNALGGFTIYIEGFVAQKEIALDVDDNEYKYETFKSWANENIKFSHTPTSDEPANVTETGITPAQ